MSTDGQGWGNFQVWQAGMMQYLIVMLNSCTVEQISKIFKFEKGLCIYLYYLFPYIFKISFLVYNICHQLNLEEMYQDSGIYIYKFDFI